MDRLEQAKQDIMEAQNASRSLEFRQRDDNSFQLAVTTSSQGFSALEKTVADLGLRLDLKHMSRATAGASRYVTVVEVPAEWPASRQST